jgi:cytochrome P450
VRESPIAPRLPIVGNGITFLRTPLRFLRETRDRYGDVVRTSLGPLEATLVSHPDLVEDVLVTRNRLWRKDHYMRTSLRPILGDGLLSSEGDFWRRQRRLAQPAFHRDRIAAYGAIMVKHAEALAAKWRDGETRDLHADMMRLTLEIVAEALFGANVDAHATEVGEALHAILAHVADPFEVFLPFLRHLPMPRRKRHMRAITRLDEIIYGMIDRRRKSDAEADDLLSMLLHARDEDGSRMSDKQLRDECMTLFLAGHETTAIALSWTWFLLSRHPRVRDAVEAEADAHESFGELRTTQHVVAESLRLYPPAWSMGREALEELDLGGFRIRRGENVWFCPWSIQRDPRWFDDPDAFRPERWDGDLLKRLHRYAYFPFGGGPRLCIGQSFAQMEAVLLLATLARRFRVDVIEEPIPAPSVTLRPRHGLRARLVKRH